MKPNGDLIWWKRLVRDAIAHLTERLKKPRVNLRAFAAEILIGRAVGPSPAPYIAEHAAMKAASETFVDGIHPARERPGVRLEDVLLFQFIQLAA